MQAYRNGRHGVKYALEMNDAGEVALIPKIDFEQFMFLGDARFVGTFSLTDEPEPRKIFVVEVGEVTYEVEVRLMGSTESYRTEKWAEQTAEVTKKAVATLETMTDVMGELNGDMPSLVYLQAIVTRGQEIIGQRFRAGEITTEDAMAMLDRLSVEFVNALGRMTPRHEP